MASIANTARASARLIRRYAPRHAPRRGFQISSADRAAQNYAMPALSPTMTEGNIANWVVKEGDSFTAGDVILEIETDKATMDVEAQDDGILVKITRPNGSKGVKVGERIGVTAEAGDDINSIEIPADDAAGTQAHSASASADSNGQESTSATQSEKGSGGPERTSQSHGDPKTSSTSDAPQMGSDVPQQSKYPLYPSVEHILHQHGLTSADAHKIPATGPMGRLLKGDVLAYLGRIEKDYPAQSSDRLAKLGRLDLSNIEVAEQLQKTPKKAQRDNVATPELPEETEIAIPISLSSVLATQKRVQDALGIFLPLSTFIARASELANDALPASTAGKPTAEDLFNSVLGLDRVPRSSRGHYVPSITGVSAIPPTTRNIRKPDIIDVLAAPRTQVAAAKHATPAALGISTNENIFSVPAKIGEEQRVTAYLERMKLALEKEPGRLVL